MSTYLSELTRGARAVHAALAVTALAATALPQAQAAGVSGQGTWETTLQGRDLDGNTANGFEAYYDTALNITWLADANYAKTSGYDADGLLPWDQAEAWVASLNVNGLTGWRLPDVKPVNGSSFNESFSYGGNTDVGYNITSKQSELAHLHYVTLGNTLNSVANTGPFSNVNTIGGAEGYFYNWTGVEFARSTASAWAFHFYYGSQGYSSKANEYFAWAVRPGDIAAVPEPQTYALLLAGVAACVAARKLRHA